MDDTLLLVNFEERFRFSRREIFEHELDLEVAPFVDIGRVMGHFSFDKLSNPQINPGIGFRVISLPNVVGRLDIGYGKDGANVFVGLDYPF